MTKHLHDRSGSQGIALHYQEIEHAALHEPRRYERADFTAGMLSRLQGKWIK